PRSPSITDDGQFVFFSSDYGTGTGRHEIWKIKTDGTGLTQLTSGVSPITHDRPVVAGGGARVAFLGTPQVGDSYDEPGELDVMTGTGGNLRTLIAAASRDLERPEITRDGTRIVFESNMNPFGTNPDGGYEIFRIQADGSGLAQVTHMPAGDAHDPSIAADGNTIVFSSDADPTGQNPDGIYQIFLIHADGTGIQQLTDSSTPNTYDPMISANGAVVIFFSDTGFGFDLLAVNADGSGLHYLTSGDYSWGHRVDDTGTWVAFMSTGNLTGASPFGRYQTYRIRTDGTGLQRVSTDATRNEYYPDISGSGTRIVYLSSANPVGLNPSHFDQLFTYDAAASQTRQVTMAPGVGTAALPASISGDGSWVVWTASAPFDESDPNLYRDLYRAPTTGGAVERIGAQSPNGFIPNNAPRTDMSGSRIVFDGQDDPTEQNPDHSFDLWLVDIAKDPEIRVGRGAPTLVSWDYEAGPLRYDVIRGDVDNLGPGTAGTVDLGPVACLENDSPDSNTLGFEDAVQPPPGHAFFFLYRGSRGLNYGPGSWGQSSNGSERAPGSGVCAP
ncbi:MAG: TolB family protein, partial [Thermoplasmata archaeon]